MVTPTVTQQLRLTPITNPDDPAQLRPPGFVDLRLMRYRTDSAQRCAVSWKITDLSEHWLLSRAAAMTAASKCHVPVSPFTLRRDSGELVVTRLDVTTADGVSSLLPTRHALTGNRRFEEEGGLGLEACFGFIDTNSSSPIADIHLMLHWTIASYLLGHTEVNAGHVMLVQRAGGWRLAPFQFMTVFPAVVGGPTYPLAKGFRMGAEWAGDHLRVDHWRQVAKWARVHPKIVFAMMRELACVMPGALEEALSLYYRSPPTRGVPQEVMKVVQRRADRLKELALAAPGQGIAGVKRPPVVREEPAQEEKLTIETVYR